MGNDASLHVIVNCSHKESDESSAHAVAGAEIQTVRLAVTYSVDTPLHTSYSGWQVWASEQVLAFTCDLQQSFRLCGQSVEIGKITTDCAPGFFQIMVRLQAQPKPFAGTEDPRQAHGGIGADAALA